MNKVVKDIIYLIIGIILAGLIVMVMFSCSPEKRALRKISKLEKRFPHLFETSHDTVFQERVIEKIIPLPVYRDTIEFDSMIIEYQTLREKLHYLEHKGIRDEGSREELNNLRTVLQSIKKSLRNGSFKYTQGAYATQDSTLSFDYTFDPNSPNSIEIRNIKSKDRIITKTKTIKVFPTVGDAFKKIWWAFLLLLIIMIILLRLLK